MTISTLLKSLLLNSTSLTHFIKCWCHYLSSSTIYHSVTLLLTYWDWHSSFLTVLCLLSWRLSAIRLRLLNGGAKLLDGVLPSNNAAVETSFILVLYFFVVIFLLWFFEDDESEDLAKFIFWFTQVYAWIYCNGVMNQSKFINSLVLGSSSLTQNCINLLLTLTTIILIQFWLVDCYYPIILLPTQRFNPSGENKSY